MIRLHFCLTELQSAIGRIQLQRLLRDIIRTKMPSNYAMHLLICLTIIPRRPENLTPAWYKFYAFINPAALADGWSRDRILSDIAELGYPALSGSCSEIYLEKCFLDAGLSPAKRLPVARKLGETSMMFLVHPTITSEQMSRYAEVVRYVVQKACR